jgi:HlyD family secretion protein
MAKSKNRRKIFIFSAIGAVLVALTLVAVFKKKEPVITVQTEKVARRNLTELVVANGKIQPVVQVTISPEVSGEIIELPVKEGQQVTNGETLVKINPDIYVAALNQAKANYESSIAAKASAMANLEKAQADYDRNLELFHEKLLSESDFIGFKSTRDVARAQLDSADDQVNVAKALVDSAQDSLIKTKIVSPLDGTISKLNSQLGERVLGTAQFAGTEILIISDLNKMEARVDVGEMDVVLIAPGQKARLDVDSFKDRKFTGTVTQIANSSKSSGLTSSSSSSSQSQEATKFEVRIRINETEAFRPGMSVSTEIETRYRTNVLTVPMASVTTRPPKPPEKKDNHGKGTAKSGNTNTVSSTPANATNGTLSATATNTSGTNNAVSDKKSKEDKAIEVVFVADGDHVKMMPVKIGICDNDYWEISEGLTEGQEVVSGGYRAISKDLEDGKKIKKGAADADLQKP